MRIWRLIRILPFIWWINFNSVVFAYDLDKCPSPWQRKLRAKALCNVSHGKYSCLYDVIRHTYIESCSGKPDYVKPGQRYVIRGERDSDNCTASRYQPFKLWSNRSSECEFLKNDCNEMGQVIANNGSTTKDRTCRCDNNKGFDFIIKPKKVCYCIPSEEDCSCYKKNCLPGQLLTQDYACVSKENPEVQDGECSPIIETTTPLLTMSSTSRPRLSKRKIPLDDSDQLTKSHKWIMVFVWLSIILTIASIGDTIVFRKTPSKRYTESTLLHIEIKVNTDCNRQEISARTEQNILKKMIPDNRPFLIAEIDTDMMPSMLYEKTRNSRFLKISDIPTRCEKATNMVNILEELSPDILEAFKEILREMKMHKIRRRLETYVRIFSYNNRINLQKTVKDNFEVIVETLRKYNLVDEIISILTEMQSLQQRVDILDNNSQSNEEIELTLEQCVIIGDLRSMLNFVYALFVIGEEDNAIMLLQKPGETVGWCK